MKKQVTFLTGIVMAVTLAVIVPAHAQSGGEDPLATLAQELNLTQAQKKKMRQIFFGFLDKQDQIPTPGQVVLDNRSMLKEIVTSADFDEQKARSFVQKVTAVIEDATVNRLRLRHALYLALTPAQQKHYLEIVQRNVAEMLQP